LRSIGWFAVCLLVGMLMWGCEDTGPNTEQPPDSTAGCSTDRDCYKKKCPQAEPKEYEKCVQDLLSSQDSSPGYTICNSGTCEDIAASTMGDGLVVVTFPEATTEKLAKDAVQWLRLYIFPPKDVDGKDITCERLKTMADGDPASLMSVDLGRYYPAPGSPTPITTDVVRSGDTLDLPYLGTNPTVPAGDGRVVVVQGFCNPTTGRPDVNTKAKWMGCKEGVTTKAGEKSTNIEVELPIQNGDRCL